MKLTHALDIDSKKIVYDGCMVTYSGTIVNLMEPEPETLLIEDIAHGLAFTCRWNGATKTYFSVAEHCCMMFDRVPNELKATALFHDAEEAYWGDIIKPLKNILPQEIKSKLKIMRHMIFNKFGIPPINDHIEKVDFELLQWDLDNVILRDVHSGMICYKAEQEWLNRYDILCQNGLIPTSVNQRLSND